MSFKKTPNQKVIVLQDEAVLLQMAERLVLTEEGEIPFEKNEGVGLRSFISSATNFFNLLSLKSRIYASFKPLKQYIIFQKNDISIEKTNTLLKITLKYQWINDRTNKYLTIEI